MRLSAHLGSSRTNVFATRTNHGTEQLIVGVHNEEHNHMFSIVVEPDGEIGFTYCPVGDIRNAKLMRLGQFLDDGSLEIHEPVEFTPEPADG